MSHLIHPPQDKDINLLSPLSLICSLSLSVSLCLSVSLSPQGCMHIYS